MPFPYNAFETLGSLLYRRTLLIIRYVGFTQHFPRSVFVFYATVNRLAESEWPIDAEINRRESSLDPTVKLCR